MEEMFSAADLDKDGLLDEAEFRALLVKADSKMKALPATAAVRGCCWFGWHMAPIMFTLVFGA